METSIKPPSGPFHVLMAGAVGAPTKEQGFDPRLEKDYVAKRNRAYGIQKESQERSVWDGVSDVEREMVGCCETLDESEEAQCPPGALDIEKEIRFAGILARDCHSMALKSLALAILERTLETHLHEMSDDAYESENDEEEEGEDPEEGVEEDIDEEIDDEVSDDESETGWKPGQKRRSPRNRKINEQRKRKKPSQKEEKEDEEPVQRLEQFLAAGGLKILNQWLVEACHEEVIPQLKAPPGTKKKPPLNSPKPPKSRPLILPILRFLEHVPFDKKLVMDSKINKQIRKLGKQVDGILEARARGKHRKEDLENWTTEPTSAETDVLDHVREAVDAIKISWEQMAKKKKERFTDPFELLKEKMRERLDLLTQFESGAIPKPDWLEIQEPSKEPSKKIAKAKKLNTQELAAKERRAEREDLQKALRAVENEHRERVQRLRETLRKRREENAPVNRQKKDGGGKNVAWKDGLKSEVNRNRGLLEEVFVFEKQLPPNQREGENDEVANNFEISEVSSSVPSSDDVVSDALTLEDTAGYDLL